MPEVPGEDDRDGKPGDGHDDGADRSAALDLRARRVAHRPVAERPPNGGDEPCAGEHDDREDEPVVRTHMTRLAVGRDAVQRERDTEDGDARAASDHEDRHALDAPRVDKDPYDRHRAGEQYAEARVREQQRDDEPVEQDDALEPPPPDREPQRDPDAGGTQERELVPVVERRTQSREPAVVGIERRHALREQRPAEEKREQHGG